MKSERKMELCRFCKKKGRPMYVLDVGLAYVQCLDCHARGPSFVVSDDICAKDKAIDGWNEGMRE